MRSFYFIHLLIVTGMVLCAGDFGRSQTDPVSVRIRLAQELERSGQTEQAVYIYEGLLAESPDNLVVFTRLKDLYIRSAEYEKALRVIEDRLRNHPREVNLEVFAAQVRYKMGHMEEAWTVWEDVLDRYAGSVSVYQSVASALIGERLLDEAIDVYMRGRDRLGSDDLYAFNLASLYAARMEYRKAVDELMNYWRAHPKHVSVVESQLRRFPNTKRVVRDVVGGLEAAIEVSPTDAELRQILAGVFVRAESFDEAFTAIREVERLRPAERRGEALYGFGQDALRSGAPEVAVRAYGELVASYPSFPLLDKTLIELARSYEAIEQFGKASECYRKVFEEYGDRPTSRQALYRRGVLLRDRLSDIVGAKAVFQRIVDDSGSTREGMESRLELAYCETILGNLELADSLYLKAMDSDQKKGGFWLKGLLGRADIAYFQGRFDDASSLLEALRREDLPDETLKNPAFNDGLMRSLTLAAHAETSGESLSVLARAELLSLQGEQREAYRLLDSLIMHAPDDPLMIEALYAKGDTALRLGRFEAGLACFDTLASRFPTHLLADQALERAGWIHEQAGEWSEALARYEILLIDYPHSFAADEVRRRIRRIEENQRR